MVPVEVACARAFCSCDRVMRELSNVIIGTYLASSLTRTDSGIA